MRPRHRRSVRIAVGCALLVSVSMAACGTDNDSPAQPAATAVGALPGESAVTDNAAASPGTAAIESTPNTPTSTQATNTTVATVPPGPTTTVVPTTPPTLPTPLPPPENPRAAEPEVLLGTIEIPKLEVSRYLFEGVTLTTLDKGPGHWPGTAMPGQVGNVVVGGHRSSKDKPFRYVDLLEPGDEVVFTLTDGSRHVYLVDRTEIVTPDRIDIITQTDDYTATLFACHPVGSVRERIIIHLVMEPPAAT
jgi:sortase A